VMEKERSLHLVDGPVYAVTVFVTADKTQYLQFTLHHAIADLVSWRILLDDLQTALTGKDFAPKTLSFKEWSERLTQQATQWQPQPWDEYMGEDVSPPNDQSMVRVSHDGIVLDMATSMQLDAANAKFGTNIQEIALAALVCAYGDVTGVSDAVLHLMMEGHGRVPWDSSLDVSSTVGWFTNVYPVMFTASSDMSELVRHVKQKMRALPDNGLSYGALKYLAPHTSDNARLKAHRVHNLSFNYTGRFQEMHSTKSLFDPLDELNLPQKESDETEYFGGGVHLMHTDDDRLAMNMSVPNWLLDQAQVTHWCALWREWMERIVAFCVDPATLGGRTLSDVPLLRSTSVVRDVEAELLWTLGLRPDMIQDMYPVTPLQSALLTAMIHDPAEYVLQTVFDIEGDFDFSRLRSSWHTLAADTPVLRTVFAATSTAGLMQAVTKVDSSTWVLSSDVVAPADVEAFTTSFLDHDRRRGFSLASTSFHRFTGVPVSDGRLRVFWTHHHALMDGWSLTLLLDTLLAIAYGDERVSATMSFRDHIEWLSTQDAASSRLFWKAALAATTSSVPLALPPPPHRPLTKYNAMTRTVHLPAMSSLCKRLGVTPSSVFRTAWAILLQQYTRCDYVTFGSVVSGRDTGVDGVEKIIGMLINTVPIHTRVQASNAAIDLIATMHALSMDLVSHSHYNLIDVKRWANVPSEHVLFDSIMVYQNFPSSELLDTSTPRPFQFKLQRTDEYMDSALGIVVGAVGNDYGLRVTHNAIEIDAAVVEFLVDRFVHVVSTMTSSPATTVAALNMAPSSGSLEQALVQRACHGRDMSLPYELVHHATEAQAQLHPDTRAIEFEHAALTYRELNTHATTLAGRLAAHGVAVGARVALVLERCLEFPLALLAAHKVGASTMSLDATFPVKRLAHILTDAHARVILTLDLHRHVIEAMGLAIPVIYFSVAELARSTSRFEPLPQHVATRDDEAYVVYTSGSTGKPKGVPVLHRGAVNVMMHMTMPGVCHGARAMQFMAIGFDNCQWEIWCTLSVGATLVLRSPNVFDTIAKVDVLSTTPTGLALLGNPDQYPNLKYVQLGGENVPVTLKDLWASRVCLTNCYGPSECAVMTNTIQLRTDYAVTIGPPIPNVSTYILDDSQCLVPVGVVGEIYLGGICVSPCYINLPEQTTERFLGNPFAPGQMYRTGDLGRMLPNGDFEILGRKDTQVKLKGYRIELEEVAEAMMQHPHVTSAAAIVKNKNHLVGYYSPANISVQELEQEVVAHLPVYMVPAVWVGLDVMPQNTNGKIDKRALEALDVAVEVEILQTETEKMMAQVWANVLGVPVEKIGRNTSFFSLGGDSISVVKVVSACRKIGLHITVARLVKAARLWCAAAAVTTKNSATMA
ncbi:hypothetical protein As57867_001525, partial [Aphanomyces stellatus]